MRKGTYNLIHAVKRVAMEIPDIQCYLAGVGEIERCREQIRMDEMQNNIKLIGWADFQKKLQLLGKVSTVVLPSYNEDLPMAILEGMA